MPAAPYRENLTLGGWKARFQHALTTRFGLRLHMFLLVSVVGASGVLLSRIFRALTHSMPLRYALTCVVSYGVFFGAVRLWLWYLTGALRDEAPQDALPDAAGTLVTQLGRPASGSDVRLWTNGSDVASALTFSTGDSRRSDLSGGTMDVPDVGGGGGGGGGGGDVGDVGEGVIAVVILVVIALVVAVVFGAAAWVVWEAPAILGEAAFELVLATALARACRQMDGRSWSNALWRATWKPALLVLFISVSGGALAQGLCPGAVTLHETVQRCVIERDTAPRGVR